MGQISLCSTVLCVFVLLLCIIFLHVLNTSRFLHPDSNIEEIMPGDRDGTFKLPSFPSDLWHTQLFTERDCKVTCGSRTFKLHSSLLVSKSKFFAQQLKEAKGDFKEACKLKEVEVHDIDPTVFGEVVQYLYDGVVGNLPQEKLAEQLMVAEKLGIEQLKDCLSEKLMLNLTEANVVETADLAQRCNAKHLLDKSVKLIVENSVKMSKDEVVKYPALVPAILEEYSNEMSVKKEEIAVVEESITRPYWRKTAVK